MLVPLAVFALLARQVRAKNAFGWDDRILDGVGRLDDSEPFRLAMTGIIHVGGDHWEAVPLILIALVAGVLVRLQRQADAFVLVAAVAGAVVAADLLQPMFLRPPIRSGMDLFPSGHAMGSMAVFAALASALWPTPWRWRVIPAGALFVLAFGVSLVYFRAHYPSDVLAGWCLALSWVAVLRLSLGRLLSP